MITRVIVDQSYMTHVQTCIISCSDHYCSTHIYSSHWIDQATVNDYVLIEDDGFDRIITTIEWYTQEAATVSQFKLAVKREIMMGQLDHHVTTEIMTFLISKTTVNQEVVSAPWGHHGQIKCWVQLILLKSKNFPKHIINDCKRGMIRLIPKSLYTVEYLNQNTARSDYSLVYLYEYNIKCVTIKDRQYHHIEYLNWGLCELRNLMNDLNVGQYYHYHNQHINQLTHTLINQAVDQYSHILGQRLSRHVDRTSTIAIINTSLDNPIIQQQYNFYLSQTYSFYTMDCSRILPRVSKHGDIDGQVFHYHLQHQTI